MRLPVVNYGGWIGAIHADWPAYPLGKTWVWALEVLATFPVGTKFFRIDHIDACSLLVTRKPVAGEDVYGDKFVHVAIFDENLNELNEQGLVTGVIPQTEYDWRLEEYHELLAEAAGRKLGYLNKEGSFREIELKPPEPDADEEEWRKLYTFCGISPDGIALSRRALAGLVSELDAQGRLYHTALAAEVDPLIGAKKFDAAIREAGVLLETRLREIVGDPSRPHGTKLLRAFENFRTQKEGGELCAMCRTLVAELRGLYRYIRNEFAHNKIVLESAQFEALLYRYSAVFSMLDEIERSDAED